MQRKPHIAHAWPAISDNWIWHPFTPYGNEPALQVTAAKGAKLYLKDGKVLIDAISSWWVNIHGHGRKEIVKAIRKQAHRLEHVIFAGFTHTPAMELATRLIHAFPAGAYQKVFFSDNGSTAVEVAAKMALQAFYNKGESRDLIIALEGAYHGDTFGAMAMGERSPFNAPFEKQLFQVVYIKPPYTADPLADTEPYEQASLDQLEKWLQTGRVAAFIFEPLVQGASGMRMYSLEWLNKAIALCQKYHTFTIADEVMTGFGRTGRLFASHYLAYLPDIICLSKAITGGFLPLGATLCNELVYQHFRDNDILKTFFHGHSYTANPIACAAAVASYDLLTQNATQKHIRRIARQHQNFKISLEGHESIIQTRQLGTILALEMRTDGPSSYINEARHHLYSYFINKGILLRPLGNVIYLMPPYIIQNADLQKVYAAINQLVMRK